MEKRSPGPELQLQRATVVGKSRLKQEAEDDKTKKDTELQTASIHHPTVGALGFQKITFMRVVFGCFCSEAQI